MRSQKKINKYAFSGGQVSTEEHRRLGGNPAVDVSYQYLTFLMDDDVELARIAEEYKSGRLLTGELKAICIKELQNLVAEFQANRKAVTDETTSTFMSVRTLEWGTEQQEQRAAAWKKKTDVEKEAAKAEKEKEKAAAAAAVQTEK